MNQRAFFAVVLCAILAGTNGIFIKNMESLNANSIAWLRSSIPTVILAVWMIYAKIPFFRGNYPKMLFASFLNAIRMYLYLVAFIYTSIGNAVIIFYSWPIFVTIMSAITLREKIRWNQVLLLITAFVGLVIAYSDKEFTFEDRDFIGMLAALLSSLVYAWTVIIFKSESNNYRRNEIIFYQNLAGLVLFLPFFIFQFPKAELIDLQIGFVYSVLVGLVIFNLFFYGLKYLRASAASSIMYIEVVCALIFSYLWFDDPLSINMIIGGSLILISSFFINRLKR
ncbi:MAG: DMT family transporter [Bacteroidota bacterium]